MFNILTIDVEDWHQASLELLPVPESVKRSGLPPTPRVVPNTERILALLASNRARATFFILGSVAQAFPELVKRIAQEGHEVASHGYSHTLVSKQTPQEFRADLEKSLDIIRGITGEEVLGYRAPFWSITRECHWALNIMAEQGLKYDCSIVPAKMRFGGWPGFPEHPHRVEGIRGEFSEFPISTVGLLGRRVSLSGGYFRVLPYWFIRRGVREINRKGWSAVIGLHPYELDTEELKGRGDIPLKVKLRQNFNRARVERKLKALLKDFEFVPVRDFLPHSSR